MKFIDRIEETAMRKIRGANVFYDFCIIEIFKQLASLILSSQTLDYFDVVKVEYS